MRQKSCASARRWSRGWDRAAGIPALGTFTCVTGVSGSGKSSLVNEVLYKTMAAKLNHARTRPGAHDGVEGLEHLDKVIAIDQSPIGRTPRSNPATYTGLFNDIRFDSSPVWKRPESSPDSAYRSGLGGGPHPPD